MAGIGFELKRLAREDGLFKPVASAGHGAIVAAGPWILTVLALSLVQRNLPSTGREAYDLQALIIYLFCISLIVTAPIVAAAVRRSADDLYLREARQIRATYFVALLSSMGSTVAAALVVFGWGFGWSGLPLLAGTAGAGAMAAIWPATAFSAAIRDFGSITRAFIVGLALSVAATLTAAHWNGPPEIQALGFAAGLWFTGLWLTRRILATFPAEVPSLRPSARRLRATASAHGSVVLGAFLAMIAIWIDSWIMWFGPGGLSVASGLPTAPLYDSAMFVARLTMLPGLVLFLGSVDTGVFIAVRRFLDTIERQGTYARIEAQAIALKHETERLLTRLILVQATLSLVVVALAPGLVGPAGLFYQQVAILRYGAAAALFQVIFFSSATLLLLLGRERRFLLVQAVFLVCNAGATYACLHLGPVYDGFGYLVATAVAAAVSMAILQRSLASIIPITFARALDQSRSQPSVSLLKSLRARFPRGRRSRASGERAAEHRTIRS